MTVMTEKDFKELEEYFYWGGHKHWNPFPKELKTKLLDVYGEEPFPNSWTEQDIFEGSRKIIIEYFEKTAPDYDI